MRTRAGRSNRSDDHRRRERAPGCLRRATRPLRHAPHHRGHVRTARARPRRIRIPTEDHLEKLDSAGTSLISVRVVPARPAEALAGQPDAAEGQCASRLTSRSARRWIRADCAARSSTACSGTSRCGPCGPSTNRDAISPLRYQARSAERDTPASASAMAKGTHGVSASCQQLQFVAPGGEPISPSPTPPCLRPY